MEQNDCPPDQVPLVPRRKRRDVVAVEASPVVDEFAVWLDTDPVTSEGLILAAERADKIRHECLDSLEESVDMCLSAIEERNFSAMRPGLAERYRAVQDRLLKYQWQLRSSRAWIHPATPSQQSQVLSELSSQLLDVDLPGLLPYSIFLAVQRLRCSRGLCDGVFEWSHLRDKFLEFSAQPGDAAQEFIGEFLRVRAQNGQRPTSVVPGLDEDWESFMLHEDAHRNVPQTGEPSSFSRYMSRKKEMDGRNR